jgi:hypothetical protein
MIGVECNFSRYLIIRERVIDYARNRHVMQFTVHYLFDIIFGGWNFV